MVHLVDVPEYNNASACARVFIDTVFRLHGYPRELVSDRNPRFSVELWRSVFKTLGTRLNMSTSDHYENRLSDRTRQSCPRRDTSTVRPPFYELERIVADSGIHHQQICPRVYDAHAVFREWLTPSASAHFLLCDYSLSGEELIRANANPSFTRHVLTMRSPLLTLMSISSTSVTKRK